MKEQHNQGHILSFLVTWLLRWPAQETNVSSVQLKSSRAGQWEGLMTPGSYCFCKAASGPNIVPRNYAESRFSVAVAFIVSEVGYTFFCQTSAFRGTRVLSSIGKRKQRRLGISLLRILYCFKKITKQNGGVYRQDVWKQKYCKAECGYDFAFSHSWRQRPHSQADSRNKLWVKFAGHFIDDT